LMKLYSPIALYSYLVPFSSQGAFINIDNIDNQPKAFTFSTLERETFRFKSSKFDSWLHFSNLFEIMSRRERNGSISNLNWEIEAIIFDLDGTLLNTEVLATIALNMSIEEFDVRVEWELKKRLLGLRPHEWTTLVIDELGLEGKIAPKELARRWEQNLEPLRNQAEEMPGAYTLTEQINNLCVPQAIATSSTEEAVLGKREKHEILFGRMAHVITGDDPEVHKGKPAPDIYLLAAERLNVNPEKCLVFEDAVAGVKAAKAAGMKVVAVPDPKLDKSEFSEADHIVDSLEHFSLDHLRMIRPSPLSPAS